MECVVALRFGVVFCHLSGDHEYARSLEVAGPFLPLDAIQEGGWWMIFVSWPRTSVMTRTLR